MVWFENWSQTGKIEEREGQAVKICAPTTEYVNEIDIAGMGDIVSLMKRYGSVRVCRSRYDEDAKKPLGVDITMDSCANFEADEVENEGNE